MSQANHDAAYGSSTFGLGTSTEQTPFKVQGVPSPGPSRSGLGIRAGNEVAPYGKLYFGNFPEMCHICSILAYPFKPRPLKNVPMHDMVPLHCYSHVDLTRKKPAGVKELTQGLLEKKPEDGVAGSGGGGLFGLAASARGFFLGLTLLSLGISLFKTSLSTLVMGQARRDEVSANAQARSPTPHSPRARDRARAPTRAFTCGRHLSPLRTPAAVSASR